MSWLDELISNYLLPIAASIFLVAFSLLGVLAITIGFYYVLSLVQ